MENEPVEYKGHRIELRSSQRDGLTNVKAKGDRKPELLIDEKPVNYGQLPDGMFFLDEYAYDWQDNLIDLAKHFIDYKSNVEKSHKNKREEGK